MILVCGKEDKLVVIKLILILPGFLVEEELCYLLFCLSVARRNP